MRFEISHTGGPYNFAPDAVLMRAGEVKSKYVIDGNLALQSLGQILSGCVNVSFGNVG
jgi:hypothetical protein